jgi:hypothetical protein
LGKIAEAVLIQQRTLCLAIEVPDKVIVPGTRERDKEGLNTQIEKHIYDPAKVMRVTVATKERKIQ